MFCRFMTTEKAIDAIKISLSENARGGVACKRVFITRCSSRAWRLFRRKRIFRSFSFGAHIRTKGILSAR